MKHSFVRFLALRALALMAVLSLSRLALMLWFAVGKAPVVSLVSAAVLGVRFDARLVAGLTLVALPFTLFAATSPYSPSRITRRVWLVAEVLVAFVLALFIISDFAHYAYLSERLNAGVITLAKDVQDSILMVWQSYPVVWLTLAVALFCAVAGFLHHRRTRVSPAPEPALRAKIIGGLVTALVCAGLIFGRAGQYPLRWSDAAEIEPPQAGAMALNPVLNFFDTMAFARKGFRPGDDLPYRSLMAARLGAPGGLDTAYERVVANPDAKLKRNLNVVVVIMESFSGYKSSVFGNPLNPTPVMKRLADEGLSFERHFTAHFGTARGVFTTMTGVPDVQLGDTATRNPRAARHRFPLEDYGFAEKHYFIGGSTTWANVRGVLLGTMPGVRIHEQGQLKGPRSDVWGVADGDLLPEAAHTLAGAKRPFFAVIQTASNHRPYTIPDAHLAACPRGKFDAAALSAAGFESPEEWDGMHYMDWSVGRLIEEAKAAGWHDDTVFVFVGDHGITGRAGANMPEEFRALPFTTGHTPLIFYSPGRIAPGRVAEPCMQADVLPTLAGFFEGEFKLRCLGHDVRRPAPEGGPLSFHINHAKGPEVAAFDGRWYAVTGVKEKDAVSLYDTQSKTIAKNVAAANPDKARELGRWARAHYHVAAQMLTGNGATAKPATTAQPEAAAR